MSALGDALRSMLRKDQPTPQQVHVDTMAAGAAPKKRKRKETAVPDDKTATAKADVLVPIWKDEAKHIIYGVALQPGVTDSQGDDVSSEEIEKSAHRFLVDSRMTDIQHDGEQADVDVIESYIAPHDMVVGGEPVLKGSWVMAHKVNDPKVWQDVMDGKLTGLSIGGSGIRVEA